MIRRGEIYLVSFDPARGSEQRGVRPALIIQNDVGNERSTKTIVAAMSSRRGPDYPFRVRVTPRESGLTKHSDVLLDQILTITQERLGRRLGHVTPRVMEDVDQALHHSLGIVFCPA
jgi:mRNA interferase MazF